MKFHKVVSFSLAPCNGYIYCFWFSISRKCSEQQSQFLWVLYSTWTFPFMIHFSEDQIVNDKLLIKCKMKDQITHILQLT